LLILVPIGYIATTGITYLTKLDTNSINTILDRMKELVKDIPYAWKDYAKEYLRIENVLPYMPSLSLYIGQMGKPLKGALAFSLKGITIFKVG